MKTPASFSFIFFVLFKQFCTNKNSRINFDSHVEIEIGSPGGEHADHLTPTTAPSSEHSPLGEWSLHGWSSVWPLWIQYTQITTYFLLWSNPIQLNWRPASVHWVFSDPLHWCFSDIYFLVTVSRDKHGQTKRKQIKVKVVGSTSVCIQLSHRTDRQVHNARNKWCTQSWRVSTKWKIIRYLPKQPNLPTCHILISVGWRKSRRPRY